MTLKSVPILFAAVATFVGTGATSTVAAPRTAADKMVAACQPSDVICMERTLASAETRLEEARKTALGAIEGGALTGRDLQKTLALFETSETSWASYRQSHCEAYGLYDKAIGGDGARARWTCLVTETISRESGLRRLFSSE
jgi:uncharacterized protein YecT (DUF1311 family)